MIAYTKRIAGHPNETPHINEDSYHESIFEDLDGRKWGLFVVGDGLDYGYGSDQASNTSMKSLRDKIEILMRGKTKDSLEESLGFQPDENSTSTSSSDDVYVTLIQNAISDTHDKLREMYGAGVNTTLDLVLFSEDDLYYCHIGDSRIYLVYDEEIKQITVDESKSGVPNNYLGKSLHGIKPKIKAHRKSLSKDFGKDDQELNFLLLATDGLHSRVRIKKLEELFGEDELKYNPISILYEIENMIYFPLDKLVHGYDNDTFKHQFVSPIKDYLNLSDGLSHEEMVREVLKVYQSGEIPEVVEHINKRLKFDDTTLVLVDLKDQPSKNLTLISDLTFEKNNLYSDLEKAGNRENKLALKVEELTNENTENLSTWGIKKKELISKIERLEETKSSLEGQLKAIESHYTSLTSDSENKQGENLVDMLKGFFTGNKAKIESLRADNSRLDAEINNTSAEKERIEKNYQELREELKDTRKDLESSKNGYDELVSNHNEEITKLNEKIKTLVDENKIYQNSVRDKENLVGSLNGQVDKLSDENKTLKGERDNHEAATQSAQGKVRSLEGQVSYLQEKLDSLNMERGSKHREMTYEVHNEGGQVIVEADSISEDNVLGYRSKNKRKKIISNYSKKVVSNYFKDDPRKKKF